MLRYTPHKYLTEIQAPSTDFIHPVFSAEDSSIATVEVSDSSSLLGDYELISDTSLGNDLQIAHDLEMLSQEVANKGPQQSELELK